MLSRPNYANNDCEGGMGDDGGAAKLKVIKG